MSNTQAATELAGTGRTGEAAALLARAGKAGDTAALTMLGDWLLRGDMIPRDVHWARKSFLQAANLGDADAVSIAAVLLANGSGGPADWIAAIGLLQTNAARSAFAADQLRVLSGMTLDDYGRPRTVPPLDRLSDRPSVWRARNFLNKDECLAIATVAAGLLEPATVIDPATGRNVRNPIRTSDTALIGPTWETPVVRAINLRVAALTATDVAQGEALTVLRYQAGQQFRTHLDALPGTSNQRTKTVLLYLNDGFQGGETVFPHAGLRVTPRAGDAIVFDNVLPEGAIDDRASHAGLPVTRGTKWLATRWIRERPFDVWQGPEIA